MHKAVDRFHSVKFTCIPIEAKKSTFICDITSFQLLLTGICLHCMIFTCEFYNKEFLAGHWVQKEAL